MGGPEQSGEPRPESRRPSRSLDVEGKEWLKNQLYAPDVLVSQGSPNKIHACIDDSFHTKSGAQQLQKVASCAAAAAAPRLIRQRSRSYEVQPAAAKVLAKKFANKKVDEQLPRQRRHTIHSLPADGPPATSKLRSQLPSASSPPARRVTTGNPLRGSPNQARSLASSPQLGRRTICSSSAAISSSPSPSPTSSTSSSPKPQARSLGGTGSVGGSLSSSPKPAAKRRSNSVGGAAGASGKSEPQPAWMARGEALVHRATQLSTQREQLDKDLEALVSEALAWLRSLSMEERMDASCHALLHRLHQGVFASCPGFRKGKQYSGTNACPPRTTSAATNSPSRCVAQHDGLNLIRWPAR